jgi:hypothetical protein
MQSNAVRAAVAVASVAVLAVLFLVLSGGDEESGEPAAETAATTTTELPADRREQRPDEERERDREPEVPTLVVADGEPRGGAEELTFKSGEQIRFEVRSDVVEEVHVHGYDIYADLEPGKTAKLGFPAELEGVFEVELHGSGALLAELSVKP